MDNLIRLQSVTQAMRARDLLKTKGIKAQVTRVPASYNKGSCGYGLKINSDINEAVRILRDNNFKVGGRAWGDMF